jgi:hypothetical protein
MKKDAVVSGLRVIVDNPKSRNHGKVGTVLQRDEYFLGYWRVAFDNQDEPQMLLPKSFRIASN